MILNTIPKQRRGTGNRLVSYLTMLSISSILVGYGALAIYLVPSAFALSSSPQNQTNQLSLPTAHSYQAVSPRATEQELTAGLWNCEGSFTDAPERFGYCVEVTNAVIEKGKKLRSITPAW